MDLPRKRKRGSILTHKGLDKLNNAIKTKEYAENNGKRFTLDNLSIQTGLDSHTLCKIFQCNVRVDKKSLVQCFKAFNLVLESDDYESPPPLPLVKPEAHSAKFPIQPLQPQIQPYGDYSLAPHVSVFYGRTAELATLNQWIQVNRYQLIMVLGMGGMGKTSLIAKLMQGFTNSTDSSSSEFKYVIWRSLRHAPTVEETLTELIHILSHHQAVDLPKSPEQLISKLMQYLHQTRCLLVLDNLESILQCGERGGSYRPGFEGYGQLIRRIGESTHKSCLIITSREPPIAFILLEKKANSIKSLILKGLLPEDGFKILQSEGINETEAKWQTLHHHYAGNPLILKIAATKIDFLFSGKIDLFLDQGVTVFGDIYKLLDQQFQRLSDLDKTVIYSLAIHRKPILMPELLNAIMPPVTSQKLLGSIDRLKWRSLIEYNSNGFTVQNDVMEYVTSKPR
ncbi:NACHT domain-containing protein [Sphaerospermopsis aphanizomenoides BCCUSP55]|uniref:NB-ARC domain-containing protein n=1 Tax=Sphaerospermopsis aphanizomenoides TaxID=459663 RepID=UPI000A868C18|nr:NB-ARC domain-containing protein [Sphaerospermopsis aphanizomenoides]MBK1989999.1 NACHT domain-containing protein [Sphaerospermopsis aphanizomenoides BCCUSP55]